MKYKLIRIWWKTLIILAKCTGGYTSLTISGGWLEGGDHLCLYIDHPLCYINWKYKINDYIHTIKLSDYEDS